MEVHTAREIGLLVRGRRQELGWSQEQLAELAGVSRKWLWSLESGKGSVELSLVLATLEAVGLRWDIQPEGATASAAPGEAPPTVNIDSLIDELSTGDAPTAP